MPEPQVVTPSPAWTDIVSAIGQLGSAVFAAITAWLALRTIQESRRQTSVSIEEMRKQTDIMMRGLNLSYAPSLLVDWEVVPDLQVWSTRQDVQIHKDVFPEDPSLFDKIGTDAKKDALELLNTWWTSPSRATPPDVKYLILQLHNNQRNNTAGSSATNIRGNLKIRVPKKQGRPREETFDYLFGLPVCDPGSIACIPIKIEGIPWMELEISSLVYNCGQEDTELQDYGGRPRYSFSYL